ncbi:MAG: ADP-glyceromanno-heptose 6-epimerase [Candidatus Omnitrophica bacterium]|nr:ADP-glyceromanno-heptose 6-epimerase [Candidatus Omnitrophota bacterium]
MRFLVTGGAGFIGSCLVWKLNQQGIDDIIVVDQMDASEKWMNLEDKAFQDYVDKARLLEYLDTNKLRGSLDVILHMGACSSTIENDASYMKTNNYLYSKKLCQWALRNKVRFLYASSAATYGAGELGYSDEDNVSLRLKPLNIYGYSKQLMDAWVIKSGLADKVVGFKFFNVFGPNEYHKGEMRSVVAKSFEKVVAEKKIRLFKSHKPEYAHGEQKRDFVYVKDAAEVVWYFVTHPQKTGIFNLGTGRARTWNDLALALFTALRIRPHIEYIEMPQAIRDKYQYFTQADLTKLRNAGCTHAFLCLEDAIKDYATYLTRNAYL